MMTLVNTRRVAMALLSVGRNAVLNEKVKRVAPPSREALVAVLPERGTEAAAEPLLDLAAQIVATRVVDDTVSEANDNIDKARKGISDALAQWIPGDLLVVYGTLLTAWTQLRGNFGWMIGISIVLGAALVFVGAAAQGGWGAVKQSTGDLSWRAIIGVGVSLVACSAVPNSGWYQFPWMRENEAAVVLTAGAMVGILVLLLKSLPARVGGNN
jgi:hypothetical protein